MPQDNTTEIPIHNPLWARVLVIVVLAIAAITAATAIIFLGKSPLDADLWSSNARIVHADVSER